MDSISSTLSSLRHFLNLLLPFTNPNTPLLQDIVHTLVLCAALYFAPVILENRVATELEERAREATDSESDAAVTENVPETLHPDAIIEAGDDNEFPEEEFLEPPPLAPTPPPFAEVGLPNDGDAGVGPANPHQDRPRATPQNRTVGAKKAKSLAKKDQRRAYHEFMRQQGDAQRAADAEGAAEREALLAEEKERRAKVQRDIQEREKLERERKKEEERKEMEAERLRREKVVEAVRTGLETKGCIDLVDLAYREGKDKTWIERLVKASGIVGGRQVQNESCTMITGGGWAIRADKELMREAYIRALRFGEKAGGKVGLTDMGSILESIVREKAKG